MSGTTPTSTIDVVFSYRYCKCILGINVVFSFDYPNIGIFHHTNERFFFLNSCDETNPTGTTRVGWWRKQMYELENCNASMCLRPWIKYHL